MKRILPAIIGILTMPGFLVAGCGGPKNLNVIVTMPEYDRTPWVAVYYLNRQNALDGYSNPELIEQEENLRGHQGVVDSKRMSIRRGERLQIQQRRAADVMYVVVAVNSLDPCARIAIDAHQVKFPVHVRIDADKCLRFVER